jgi:predicted HTH domain antitoxin
MGNIVLEIPRESALGLRVPVDEAGNIVRMAAAAKLFEMGQLSSGAAARLAGVPRVIFLSNLAEYGVDTFRLTETQLAGETRLA